MTNNRALNVFFLLVFAFLVQPDLVLAQNCSGEIDSTEKAMNYSLYYESYKNKDYHSALPYLKWMLECAPGFAGPGKSDDRNFDRAVKLYQGLADGIDDATIKRAYLDTALVLFDQAVPTLIDASATIDEHEWSFNKGRFIQKNAQILDDKQDEVGQLYKAVYDGNADLLNPVSYYINTIIADYARNDEKDLAVEFMDDVESKYGSDENVMEVIDTWRNRLFDTPEERMSFLEGQLEKDPQDVEIIEELLDILEELGEREKLHSMLDQMLSVAPSPIIYIKSGVMKLNDGDTQGAVKAFNTAMNMPGGDKYAKEVNFNLGNAAREEGQLAKARRYYRRALAADRSFGTALMEIAAVYAEAVRDCGGSKMDREDRAVYWLVVDYLERARATDSSLRNAANRTIQQYKPYFPAAEDLFFKSWTEGDSYAIDYGCYSWIGETTKVRKP